jgi:outer membrane protein
VSAKPVSYSFGSLAVYIIAPCLLMGSSAPAHAFDPLFAMQHISPTAGGEITGSNPCDFGRIEQPLPLIDAVERGLCHNPKTREAWAGVKAQSAAVGAARAAFLPTLSASWQSVRDNSSTDVNGHPQLSSDNSSTVRSESATLSWVLYDFGGRSAALRNASELLAAANATQDATLQVEFAAVAKDYYAAQAAVGALAAAKDIEDDAAGSLKAASARVDKGVAPITDALQAQTQHEESVFNRTKAEGDLQVALGTLASDIGLDPDEPLVVPSVTDGAAPNDAFNDSVADLIAEVKQTHPGVLAARAQYQAAVAKADQTRAEGLPNVSLVGKYSRNNQPASLGLGIPEFPATGRDAYVGIQVSIPLFEGFGRHYQIRQAEAEAERQADIIDEVQQQVTLDVWTAYQALRTATQNAQNSTAMVEIARRSYDAAEHRYQASVGNILELLNTQTALANAQQRRIQALTDWRNAKIQLAAKLGRLNLSDTQDTTIEIK